MQQNRSIQERLRAYAQQGTPEKQAAPLDLSGCDLSGYDLHGLDLQGVNFTGADLTHAHLEGARLQTTTLHQTCLVGIPVQVLLTAGLSPRFLLQHRSEADRRKYSALHFSPVASPFAPLRLSARECAQICRASLQIAWEQLADKEVFTILYPQEPWDRWMTRCHTRLILSWALEHRAFLNRTTTLPLYGRVLPSTFLDEVEESDLVAGNRTNPERVFSTLGLRRIIAQSAVPGNNVRYPSSPFGDAEGIVQIKDRRSLQLEGGLMHHCVASCDSQCVNGLCFIYHIGSAAPEGSTLEIFPNGEVGQHRAICNRTPSQEDRAQLAAWLTSLGLEQEAGSRMERICARLHQAGIVKVSFQTYWYNDEDTIADVHAEDIDGQELILRTVSDDDLWELLYESQGVAYGQWELMVKDQQLIRVGEPTPPDDDEYGDEDQEWEEE